VVGGFEALVERVSQSGEFAFGRIEYYAKVEVIQSKERDIIMTLHTEWISYGSDGQFSGYLAKPERTDEPLPAIIVLQEVWGVDEHIQDVARRFAQAGYIAFAPDLYALNGTRPEPLSAERIDAAKQFMDSLQPGVWHNPEARAEALGKLPEPQRSQIGETMSRIFQFDFPAFLEKAKAAAAYLRDEGRKVGSVGFCMGGALSAQLACSDPELAAAVIFYGNAPQPEQLKSIACPILGFYGGKDPRITDSVPAFAEAMKANGKSFEYHVYEDAPHAFFNDTRASYRTAPSRDAFARTLAFFNQLLA
jgi:carboxymethylenebutenolidase